MNKLADQGFPNGNTAFQAHQALQGEQEYKSLSNKSKDQGPSLASDVGINAGISGGVALFQKPKHSQLLNRAGKIKLKSLNVGGALAGGLAAGIPMHYVNKYTSDASSKLSDYYSKKDKDPSYLHAGLIAAPAVAGGVYTLGAITHSMDAGKNVLKAKSWGDAGRTILHTANPIEHVKRGITETKNAFKDVFTRRKVGGGTRGMGLLNLVGIAASAIPSVYSYFKNREQDHNHDQTLHNLGYIDDVANAASAATAKPLPKIAAYMPVITPLLRMRDGAQNIKKAKDAMMKGESVVDNLEEGQKTLEKGIEGIKTDLTGLAVIGSGIYGYKRYKEREANNPYTSMRYGR